MIEEGDWEPLLVPSVDDPAEPQQQRQRRQPLQQHHDVTDVHHRRRRRLGADEYVTEAVNSR